MLDEDVIQTLNDGEKTVYSRLKIARDVFLSSDKSLETRAAVLNWIELNLKAKNSFDRQQSYEILEHCMKEVSDFWVYPLLMDEILTVLSRLNNASLEQINCILAIVQNSHSLYYFSRHIEKMATVIDLITNNILNMNDTLINDSNNDFKTSISKLLLHSILLIKNDTLNLTELTLIFIQKIAPSLIRISMRFEENGSSSDFDSCIETCLLELVFGNTLRQEVLCNLYSPATNIIFQFPKNVYSKLLEKFYSLFFAAFSRTDTSAESQLELFVALNSYIDIVPIDVSQDIKKNVIFNEYNLRVANGLIINILIKYDLPVHTKYHNFSLCDWLLELAIELIRTMDSLSLSELYTLLESIVRFQPNIIDNILKAFIKNGMVKKKERHIISAYSELCVRILGIFIKLNRMQKLISILLIELKENLASISVEDLPDKLDILPSNIFNIIESTVTTLPSMVQNFALFNTLLFHLEKDCIVSLREQEDKTVDRRLLLVIDLVSDLLSRFISGSRIADHSIPNYIQDKFVNQMIHLGDLLGRFGKAIIAKEHVPLLTQSYLRLCLMWGDMQLILMVYESSRRVIPKQVGPVANSPTNLVYLHPYLTDYEWKLIAQRVVNFGDEACTDLLKIDALPSLEDEYDGPYLDNVDGDGPAASCAQFLVTHANARWLFHNVRKLMEYLPPRNILMLCKSLVKYWETCDDEKIAEILETDFQQSRPLIVGMVCYVLHNIAKKMSDMKLKVARSILKKLDFEDMVQIEMLEEGAAQKIKDHFDEIGTHVLRIPDMSKMKYDFSCIRKDVTLLLHISSEYLHIENRTLISLLGLILLTEIRSAESSEIHNEIVTDILLLLKNVMSNVIFPFTVDLNGLFIWFYNNLKENMYHDSLIQHFCHMVTVTEHFKNEYVNLLKKAFIGETTQDEHLDVINAASMYIMHAPLFKRRKRRRGEQDDFYEQEDPAVKFIKAQCFLTCHSCLLTILNKPNPPYEQLLAPYVYTLKNALENFTSSVRNVLLIYVDIFFKYIQGASSTDPVVVTEFINLIFKYDDIASRFLFPEIFAIICTKLHKYTNPYDCKRFLIKSNSEYFTEVLSSICMSFTYVMTSPPLLEDPRMSIEAIKKLIAAIFDISVQPDKEQNRITFINSLQSPIQHLMKNFTLHDDVTVYIPAFNLVVYTFTAWFRATKVPDLTYIYDAFFDFAGFTGKNIRFLLPMIDCTFVACTKCAPMMLNRSQCLLQIYKLFFNDIIVKSQDENSDLDYLITCAHKLEKLTDRLVSFTVHLKKAATYLLPDLLKAFQSYTVPQGIKIHLKNIICYWISITNKHGLEHLSVVLPESSMNLLKEFQEQYKKYVKFSGKV